MKKRIVPLFLSATMLLSLLASCNNPEETPPTVSPTGDSTAVEDGYINAPYTADASQVPSEYLAPVFYHNDNGPTISVIYNGVIVEDGEYFRDSDNDQELDPFEDWRLSTDERVADLLGKMTQEQRIGLLKNALSCSPAITSAEDAYDESGNVILGQLVSFDNKSAVDRGSVLEAVEFLESGGAQFASTNVLDLYNRSGVIRKDTDTETGALFNNALNMLAEYVGVTNGEVTIPYMLISNPMTSGFPSTLGVGAAVTGEGNADVVKTWAEIDSEIWDAKGIHQMYGPQIDLATDPRYMRNITSYTEDPEVMAQIATALVDGYQHGTDGVKPGSVGLIMKHFPGDGTVENGFPSHEWIGQWRVYSTEGSLEKYQLVGFQAAIDAKVAGIMPSYSRPATDARSAPQTVNGIAIEPEEIGNAYNPTIVQTLLKDAMGFTGFVNSDSDLVSTEYYGAEDLTVPERYATIINAGTDVIGDGFDAVVDYEGVTEAVTSGLVTEEALNRATTNRMISWIDLGMFENPYRDPAESKAIGEQYAQDIEDIKAELHQKSVVLMKNSDNILPLADTSLKIYVQKFTTDGTGTDETCADTLAARGYTIVEDYNEADVAILMVAPSDIDMTGNFLSIIDLVEDQEVDEYDLKTGEKTGDTVDVTTLQDVDEIKEVADAVHANGGKVIGTIRISSPWVLTNLEPYCDALLGIFESSNEALVDVLTGAYNPTAKLPLTMVSCNEVIAVEDKVLEDGETYEICASPNDVPGYEKDQYMDADVLAQSPSGSYAYQDADGNIYRSGFGLSY